MLYNNAVKRYQIWNFVSGKRKFEHIHYHKSISLQIKQNVFIYHIDLINFKSFYSQIFLQKIIFLLAYLNYSRQTL